MPAKADYLAIDIGASSGRAVLGSLDSGRLTLREIHRFPNDPIQLPSGLHWDAARLFKEVKRSLSLAWASAGATLAGVGIDTWGVDYGLLSDSGELLAPPHHYRDPRTHGLMEEAFGRAGRDHIYARTGIQFMELNTLYQLLAEQRSTVGLLAKARMLLFMPDLLNYWLTGVARTERTIASTSQMYDTGANVWAVDLIEQMGLPARILPPVASPGSSLAPLLPAIAQETGAGPVTVIAPASHDTASAVAAVPASTVAGDWAYISSGTWCLVGRELRAPVRTPQALAANFTNESGVEGTIRFHKNITGLWLLQECRRIWAEQGHRYTFEQLVDLAQAATPLAALIDPDHPSFAEFGDMPERVRAFCARSHQTPPDSHGAMVRCILESLALKCRLVIELLENLTGPIRTLHIVGGGAHNSLLCQFLADASARPVLAGPIEATAAGNILSQALAHRAIGSLSQLRAVVSASLRPVAYEPRATPAWAAAISRFSTLPTV